MMADTNRITTPCGAQPTASEVLEGIDLSGRRMIVTAAFPGIGVETARALAGAEVNLRVRSTDADERAASDIAGKTGNPREPEPGCPAGAGRPRRRGGRSTPRGR